MNKIIIIFLLLFVTNIKMKSQENIIYKPIGVIHSKFSPATGAPRQGVLMPDTKATIELYEEYHEALETLSLFEYIIIIYHFSEVKNWESYVTPPASKHKFGLFSTRSPKRPNPIGIAIVKLEKIENNILYISGTDAFDGTPLLDIKPYLPSIDCVNSPQNELIEKELGHHDEIFINDSNFYK